MDLAHSNSSSSMIKRLLSLLNNTTISLSEIESQFSIEFVKQDHFRLHIHCIEMMNDKFLSPCQVIASHWLMYHFISKSSESTHSSSNNNKYQQLQSQQNCFIPFLLSRIDPEYDPCERSFIYNIMSSIGFRKDYSSRSSRSIYRSLESNIYDKNGQLKPLNTKELKRQLSIDEHPVPLLELSGIRSWFRYKPDSNNNSNSINSSSSSINSSSSTESPKKISSSSENLDIMSLGTIDLEHNLCAMISSSHRSLYDLKPVMVCIPPPIIPMDYDDILGIPELPIVYDAAGLFSIPPSVVKFHNSSDSSSSNNNNSSNINNSSSFVNDNKDIKQGGGVGNKQSFDEEYRTIFASAFVAPLTSQQQQKILSNVHFDLAVLIDLGMIPEKLPLLIELNEKIAMECLLQIADDAESSPFLTALVNSDLSLHSIEVVNRLINANKLPAQFINEYISHSFSFSYGIKDKSLQNRLVRLFCVFLQALVRNKILISPDMLLEIQNFCMNFSKIKEAMNLYSLLRRGNNTSASPGGSVSS